MIRVGYLGPQGTYSEAALIRYKKKYDFEVERVAASSFMSLFAQLKANKIDEIIIPIENSLEGPVTANMDLLVQHANIYIKNELILPIRNCLLAKNGMTKKDIKVIYSHSQPLSQCKKFIGKNLAGTTIKSVESTAKAAEIVMTMDNAAAIGSKSLSSLYSLKVLEENISDHKHNMTRFAVLSGHRSEKTKSDKTSIVFSTKQDQPGSLFTVLEEFAKEKVNLTRIESRPAKSYLGEYLFFLDFDGHVEEKRIKQILQHVEKKSSFYKWLGSYPKDNLIINTERSS